MTAARGKPSTGEESASRQIDVMIEGPGDWQGEMLSRFRAIIRKADPGVVEEVKWRRPSNPMGVPVWSHDGIVCMGGGSRRRRGSHFPRALT